jgi:hypothetical protein
VPLQALDLGPRRLHRRGTDLADDHGRGVAEAPSDWPPDVLELPEDVEVLADRQIGSTLRMLTLRTSADVDDLLIEWDEALRATGYAVGRGRDDPLDGVIEFSGTNIANAKIVAVSRGSDARGLIEIDATLR